MQINVNGKIITVTDGTSVVIGDGGSVTSVFTAGGSSSITISDSKPPRKHGNGGGLVGENANVAPNAWVGPNAAVTGNATVGPNARIEDGGRVSGNASVTGRAVVKGNVSGNARVSGDAVILGDVSGNAVVAGSATVGVGSSLSGNSRLS